ncbi:hypothetical protein [Ascidiimonas sp. W6]|uniref:hypothetical protein n=1 Tax=Ascidiimonas meishanensis TaxID=3128903 RepID=UPI0030EF5E81
MKIPLTISIMLLPCLKVLSQNIDFEKKAAIDLIVNKYVKEYLMVGYVHRDDK